MQTRGLRLTWRSNWVRKDPERLQAGAGHYPTLDGQEELMATCVKEAGCKEASLAGAERAGVTCRRPQVPETNLAS